MIFSPILLNKYKPTPLIIAFNKNIEITITKKLKLSEFPFILFTNSPVNHGTNRPAILPIDDIIKADNNRSLGNFKFFKILNNGLLLCKLVTPIITKLKAHVT
ncbi:Uncharacterised protein [Staphylococcus aureus]|uniref:Uncharacterized protein n=1 Tax=Staphylococcus aureus TaxID=1280 RepID=B6GUP7_STAAU|nr:unknown [Staphylococcus aureus]QFX79324.1 hypothetical protein [Staphylococcus aureus]CAC5443326.1 Uncharacterised protein [Staphylococcus aureus]SGS59552.1 Uncharacterised protein [Staphylococcus aureus]GBU73107.1 hypothetical protein M1C041_2590 [Staphylococcus aureus]